MPSPGSKPALMPVDGDAVPEILRRHDRWLGWTWTWNADKNGGAGGWDKPPLDVRTGRNGSSTDRASWTSFETAFRAHERGDFDGCGFALGNEPATQTTFSGLDLDDCMAGGEVSPDAMYLASSLDSYAELSPSGNGIKVFCLGSYPRQHRCTKKDLPFEIYDGGRYFTVTGHRLPWAPADLRERTTELAHLYDKLFPPAQVGQKLLSEPEIARAALDALDPSRANGYMDWLLVGMALHSVSEDLLPLWDEWSQKCPDKYAPGVCEKKWQSFRRSGVGLGSLVFWAKQDGWREGASYRKKEKNVPALAEAPSRSEAAANRKEGDDDPHMGDGLTEEDGAGPWHLKLETGKPPRYLLRSPIWAASCRLADGYLVLTHEELFSWKCIRKQALDQAGVYAKPDQFKKPIWDGNGGPRLLKRLIDRCEVVNATVDFNRLLTAAEYLLDLSQTAVILSEEKKPQEKLRSMRKTEEGDVVFKLRNIAAACRRDGLPFSFEDLRDAALHYGREDRPRFGSTRHRAYVISARGLLKIAHDLSLLD